MKIACCKCKCEIDEKRGDGVTYSYCDRCVAVAGLELWTDRVSEIKTKIAELNP